MLVEEIDVAFKCGIHQVVTPKIFKWCKTRASKRHAGTLQARQGSQQIQDRNQFTSLFHITEGRGIFLMGRNLQSAEKSRLIWEAGRSVTSLSSTAMEQGSLKNNM